MLAKHWTVLTFTNPMASKFKDRLTLLRLEKLISEMLYVKIASYRGSKIIKNLYTYKFRKYGCMPLLILSFIDILVVYFIKYWLSTSKKGERLFLKRLVEIKVDEMSSGIPTSMKHGSS